MKNTFKLSIKAVFLSLILSFLFTIKAEDQIKIVGSSTVFPFSTAVAEEFGRKTKYKTPIVERIGSGGGMKIFCKGYGKQHPDITNASRRIKSKEFKKCSDAGIKIIEIKVGYDGIVLANSKKANIVKLSTRDIYMALAEKVPANEDGSELQENPYQTWKDINPNLPDVKIEVLGPPPTSGTRDAFVELAMEAGAKTFPALKELRGSSKAGKSEFKKIAATIREDGAFIEAGENDNLIIQKLDQNPNAIGIFGFSFLDQNTDKIQGSIVNGAKPTFDNILVGDYPISRSLFFYVKKNHIRMKPSITEFVREFTSDSAMGPYGYLIEKGLIPLSDEEYTKYKLAGDNQIELELD
ncbi:MAG: phosphate ABC transporter substrate-binding protein [Rhodobiaceae bacterium]|jgi:phosphate transport system substrate-binding protein|nr:phosphate ABC transporter substrate-binding protein [Rhodobiaceae bacterium]